MATRMLQRRGTAAEWAAANPALGDGEIGVEEDTGTVKIGDGTTLWNALTNVYKRASEYVAKAGATMTGQLVLPSLRFGTADFMLRDETSAGAGLRVVNPADNAWRGVFAGTVVGSTAVYDGANRVYSLSNPPPNAFSVIDALGDILVGSGPDAVARLAKGANGTVLRIDGSGNVTWGNPWDIVDAAGDLIVGSGADAVTRLAKGANGTVLTVDGSGNLSWAVPAAADLSSRVARTGDGMTGKLTMDIDTTGTAWSTASIEIQDTNRPRIAFHQPGSVASSLGQEDNTERLRTYDNAGTGYAEFAAGAIYDNNNRVYSASNPPPVSGMKVLGAVASDGNPTNPGGQQYFMDLNDMTISFVAPPSGFVKVTYGVESGQNSNVSFRITQLQGSGAGSLHRVASVAGSGYENFAEKTVGVGGLTPGSTYTLQGQWYTSSGYVYGAGEINWVPKPRFVVEG